MAGGSNSWRPDPHATGYGNLYQGLSFGIVATVLSWCTNLYVTAAVALKAWYVFREVRASECRLIHYRQSRRSLKRYIVTGAMVSQTEKVLSLLVESGAIYSAIWVSFVHLGQDIGIH